MSLRILVFGSRNLTARHLSVMRTYLALDRIAVDGWWQVGEPIQLVHGDGPPGKTPGAIGADKLAEVAASLEWPDTRRVRRFPPTPVGDESWGTAAARRNAEMVALKPDRALCVHENLDASRGSIITADCLKRAGIVYRYVRVTSSGAVIEVTER